MLWRAHLLDDPLDPSHSEASAIAQLEGTFVLHWEVMRFAVLKGRRLFGLLPKVELWFPHFPDGALDACGVSPLLGRDQGKVYRMHVSGRLGPIGHFGHMGLCSRELFVCEILACEATTEPGPTW
jgi:hypothetical protein